MSAISRNKMTVFLRAVCAAMLCACPAAAFSLEPAAETQEDLVQAVVYTSEGLRDPFEGYIKKEQIVLPVDQLVEEENFVPPPVMVSGITWGSSFPQAIINGKVVRAGDMVGEVQVVSISKEGLVLSYNNQRFSLPAPGLNKATQSGQQAP